MTKRKALRNKKGFLGKNNNSGNDTSNSRGRHDAIVRDDELVANDDSDDDSSEKVDERDAYLSRDQLVNLSSSSSSEGSASDEDDDVVEKEDDGDEDEGPLSWGRRADDFYKEDEESGASSEADEEAEEREAIRLQKKEKAALKRSDYQLDVEDEEEECEDGSSSQKKQQRATTKIASRGSLERKRAGSGDGKAGMDDERDEDAETASAEVAALIQEFNTKSRELRESVVPLLERLRADEAATTEGVTFLETKLHLLLSYVTNITFYLLLRAEQGGAHAESHPVVTELVRLRTMLDKMRPLEAKLEREFEKVMSLAAPSDDGKRKNGASDHQDDEDDGEEENGGENGKDLLAFRPELSDFNVGEEEEEEEEEEGNRGQAHFSRDGSLARHEQKQRRLAERAMGGEILQGLREEFEEAPAEMDEVGNLAGRKARGGVATKDRKAEAREAERKRYEEEYFTRVPQTREDKVRRREMEKRAREGGGADELLEGLEEEYRAVEGLLKGKAKKGALFSLSASGFEEGGEDDDEDEHAKPARREGLGKYVNEFEQARRGSKRAKYAGGDDDVAPVTSSRERGDDNDDLATASSTTKTKKKRGEEVDLEASVADYENGGRDDDDEETVGGDSEAVQHYRRVASEKKEVTKRKADAYKFPERRAREEPVVGPGEARIASVQIIKNRGLTPHRNKDLKTPRARMRDKFERKQKARKGQVREVRAGEADKYEGERTGVRANVVRSRMPKAR